MDSDGPRLETERLLLRPFVASDLDAYAAMTADAEVMQYMGGGVQYRVEAERSLEFVQHHWLQRGFGLWAAEERASGELVGRIGLLQLDGRPGLELGWLVARARWGEGFASEGGRASLDWGFEQLETERILSFIDPRNEASIRVAQKLGEHFDRSMDWPDGRMVSVYAIDRQTWENRKRAHA